MVTQAEYIKRFREIAEELAELTQRKNSDYAGNADAFQNFRAVEFLNTGISVEQGILVRMTDKLQRIINLLKKDGVAAVTDESIEDTLSDLAVYSIIMRIYREGKKLRGVKPGEIVRVYDTEWQAILGRPQE